jgi:acyl carrier protein
MTDVDRRLIGCFQVIFPDLRETEIPHATQDSVAAWDSVATVTLANVIEEEFGIEVDLERLAELDSFDRMRSYVQSQA